MRVGIDRSGEGKGGRVGIDTDEWVGIRREVGIERSNGVGGGDSGDIWGGRGRGWI